MGAGLILVPNTGLGLLGLPPTNEIWIQVLGVVTLVLGRASPILIALGSVDLLGALWTAWTLRAGK